jgi:hypothetical protein
MAISKEDMLDTIAGMTVMEIVELISAMEEKFGVSAAAAVAAALGRRRGRRAGRGKNRVRRSDVQLRREESRSDQGGARPDRPGPEGSQGSGGRRAVLDQGSHSQGRSRRDQEEA